LGQACPTSEQEGPARVAQCTQRHLRSPRGGPPPDLSQARMRFVRHSVCCNSKRITAKVAWLGGSVCKNNGGCVKRLTPFW
jgi:hypothetical protein